MTITIQYLYYLVGLVLAVTAVMTLRDRAATRAVLGGLVLGAVCAGVPRR
jgi:uncharacterized membrane protein